MKLIFGREPKIAPPSQKKWDPLWQALQKDPSAWVGIALKDMPQDSAALKRGTIKGAAHREGLKVDVVVDGAEGILFVRLTPGAKSLRSSPAVKAAPAPPHAPVPAPATPTPAPKPIPTPAPAVKPLRASGPKDPAVVAVEFEVMLNKMIADDDGEWYSTDLGTDASFYSTYKRELKTMAKERNLVIEVDRDGSLQYAQITGRKAK